MVNSLGERRSSWTIAFGRGCRHQLDVAPFSLWDVEFETYIYPTEYQLIWIFKNYGASLVEWSSAYGILTIFTDTPALLGHAGLVTLTIACAPVIFVPREAESTFWTGPPMPNSIVYCRHGMPDTLPRFNSRLWTGPCLQEAQMILDHLRGICNVNALNFVLCADLIVELADDGRRYEPGSLPNTVGGWFTLYHHDGGDDRFWKDAIPMPTNRSGGIDQGTSSRKGHGIYSGVRFVETEDPTSSITSLTNVRPSYIYFGLGITSGYSV